MRMRPEFILDVLEVYGVYIHRTMFLTIDTDDPRPIYQQVADGIKELIARGKLEQGVPLPPVRQLAADLGVNLNTIAIAYRELQKDGLIVIKHGSGSVVASSTSTERSQDELLRPLRTALTELVLAGLSSAKILSMVLRELRTVARGSK
jgi:GntR family transcriptional regulator